MKATKLKRGWRLNLSDSEMEVLCEAVAHLQADWTMESDRDHLSAATKAAFSRSFSALAWPAEIDDRRNA